MSMKHLSIISFFWPHIRPYKWYYFVMLIAPFTASFYPFAYTYALKLFIDTMTIPPTLTYQSMMFPIGIFLTAQLTLELVWRINNFCEYKAAPYVRKSILIYAYDYIQYHAYSFFQDNLTGTIHSKIQGIVDGYDRLWDQLHRGLGLRILKSTINVGTLILINYEIGLFFLIWSILFIYSIYTCSLTLKRLSCESTESRHTVMGIIADNISNIMNILSFVTKAKEVQALDQNIVNDFIPKEMRVYQYSFKIKIIAGCLHLFLFTAILWYMIYLKIINTITVGDFAQLFGILLITSEEIWHITVSLQDFSHVIGNLKSGLSILWPCEKRVDVINPKTLKIKHPSLEFKNVYFNYKDQKSVFKNLSLRIKPGEKIGLVGHSGAGKSSLVNLILRYFDYERGIILIDSQNIQHVTEDSLRSQIAVIPQDISLFHRTLMENIRYGNLDATDEEVVEASKKAHMHNFISALPEQYNTYVGERGVKLSGGQRQRVAIARAILKDAPILILDEATSALDSQTENLIQDSLHWLLDQQKKTVIAIAHRLSTLKHMDRIIVLDHGKIVEQGTHEQLMEKPDNLYRELWELQENKHRLR
ncbi:ABC transporter ATP-binding protein [Candidatus Cardinium hertigii]|uniref:Multidrug export ATP-binding/permease protein n=1 Tax=Candidatus Cardinium hertigii TaxID=247481 RepID=A0A2Z3LI04_9BACT|nr:ABC transporter ATP-binding protein [Candidatus Cardinium hertigii]AWN81680.1 Putative multidrug export ATP-binding/permease protein [Candidatus Cardinium hertigii]